MGSHRENSTAAIDREDMLLTTQTGMDAFMDGEGSKYTFLRSAGFTLVDSKAELNWDGPSMHTQGSSAVEGIRAAGSEFIRAKKGKQYTANLTPTDLGLSVDTDKADEAIKRRMRMGGSFDDMLEWAFVRSFEFFVEQIEMLGVVESGGLGNATTPFDSTLAADYDAQSSGSGAWDSDTSNPITDVETIKDGLKNDMGVFPNTGYMSSTVRRALRTHPALTAQWGGNVGLGGLTDAMIAESLGLEKIYVGDPDSFGEYVTICTQGAPGGFIESAPNRYTVIYGYDPEQGTGQYGIQMTQETQPGTSGRNVWATTHAFCGVCVNPIGGRRISNVLA